MDREPRILAIDDVPDNLLLLCDLLEERGYHVSIASNVQVALKNINNTPPDLILLDICMPGMSGYRMASQLKSDPKTKEIPIIFVSILEDAHLKVKAFRVGGADYITKPFQVEEVIARIEHQITIQQQKNELKQLKGQLLEQNQILEQRNYDLQVLLTLTKIMNTAETLDRAIAQVLTKLCQVMGWDYGEAWILNTAGTELESSEAWYARNCNLESLYNNQETTLVTVKKELVETVAKSQEIISLLNLEDLAQLSHSDSSQHLQQLFQDTDLKRLLGVPIIFKETVLAVLLFSSNGCNDHHESTPVSSLNIDQLELIQSVATQLGALMQRLRTEMALKQANDKLQHLVSYDGLTEIANRRRFDEYLDEQWRQGKRDRAELSLILCDLDAFKLYNDTLGHQAGDSCLQEVAKAITTVVNRPLDLVARYGGEEIAVLLPNTSQIGAFQLAEKICETVKDLKIPHPHSPVSHHVTISVGVSSIIPRDDCAPKMLIRMADNALYQAKELGRDRVILNNQLTEELSYGEE
ncbi:MAG: diguanylate cyclase [Halothece sp. Uz-M2-17]|nr:diguanylate cyclase [Halothece sp. Uz-M2-17]